MEISAQEFKAYSLQVPDEKITIDLVSISGGTFTMDTNDKARPKDEKPAHKVTVSDFWMGKGSAPAVNMTQYAALAFCKWFSAKTTMTAILGRMATYSGQEITWEQAMASDLKLVPNEDELNFDSVPPVVSDQHGNYPIPVPGETKFNLL